MEFSHPMSLDVLFPSLDELAFISDRVGGFVIGRYSFPAGDLGSSQKMATQIATGQTLGYVPENLLMFADYVGRVKSVSLDGDRGVAEIAFPKTLFGDDLSGLLTILFGKISFVPGLRLEAIHGDANFLRSIHGPHFGLDGIRRLIGSHASRRPLLMAILKPGIGPSDDALASQFASLVGAGTDLVKDDETRIDLEFDNAKVRLEKVLNAGQGRGIYVMHLSGPAFEIRDRALKLQSLGAQAFLFCPFTYGISVLQALGCDPEIKVPIFAHPALTGVMTQGSNAMAPEVALGTLMRWAGSDAVLFPSPYGSISLPRQEALAVHRQLTQTQGDLKMTASVPSAGITSDFVKLIRSDFGLDVVINAGTGMAKSGFGVEKGAKDFLREIAQHYPA